MPPSLSLPMVFGIATVGFMLGLLFGVFVARERYRELIVDHVHPADAPREKVRAQYQLSTILEGIDKYEGKLPWPEGPWKSSDRVALLMSMLSVSGNPVTGPSAFQKGAKMGDNARTDGAYYNWLNALVQEGIARKDDRQRPHTYYRRTDAGRIPRNTNRPAVNQ